MTTAAPTREDVLAEVDALGPPGTPVTTPEVAETFSCTKRTIYNRLNALADDGRLQTKKVGANSRVWWRPVDVPQQDGAIRTERDRVSAYPVFDSVLVGVIVWGDGFTISDANDAFLEMAGLDYEEAVGTSWRDLTPEEFYDASERHIEQLESEGSDASYEKQYYHADGSRRWGLFSPKRVSDDEVVEFVVDVTERKRQEDRERFLRELGDRIRDCTTEDAIGKTCTRCLAEELDLDRAYFVRLFHDDEEAVVGPEYHHSGLDPVSGRYPFSAFPEAIQQIQSETPVYDDVANDSTLPAAERQALLELGFGAWVGAPVRVRDGEADWALYAVSSEPHEWADADVSLIEDVADRVWPAVERARAQRSLEESEQRLQAATDAAEFGIWEVDLRTGEELYTSPRYADIFGYDELPDNWNREQARAHFPPDERERLLGWLDDGIGERTFESRITRTDGEERWISIEAEVYEDGEPVRAVGTIRDVTERKEREQRERFLRQLDDALRPLTDPTEVKQVAARLVGERLQVDRAAYGELQSDGETMSVARDWAQTGVSSVTGEFRGEDYGTFFESMRNGEVATIEDAIHEAEISEETYERGWGP